ncbi:hypothetical protein [Cellvibrio sp.]|uniref:hypothetical protein n=1 Tax=Cellvibrio sp. TaxID=1965322 RepID=UPI0039648A22
MAQSDYSGSANSNDEIDLLDLFRKVFATWKTLVISLLMVSVAFGVIKAAQLVFTVTESVYSKPIRLTFPNANKLVFPSGAKFAYSDIVAPAVVQVAYERNKLSDYGLSVSELQAGLSAAPYAPTYPLVIARYQKLMADKKLTVENLNDIQKQMEKEIEQITSGEAVITLRLEKKELPKDVAEKVLNDIPAIWAERAMKEKGVLTINAQLASVNSLNSELFLGARGVELGDLINDKLALLKKNIKSLSEYEGAQSVVDPKTGMRLMDLSFAVGDFGNFVAGDLVSPLRQLGLSKDVKSSTYFYEDRVSRLKIMLASQKAELDVVTDAYNSYLQYERKTGEAGKDGQNGNSVAPQLSADMLDKLVNLSGDAVREKYKQELNEKRFSLTRDVAETESKLADSVLVLNALQKSVAAGGKLSVSDEQYLNKVKEQLPAVISKIQDFFGVSERIYKQLSIESVGIRDQLYIPVTNTILVKKVFLDVKETIFVWIALLFLTTVIVVPSCMIRNSMRSRALVIGAGV